MASTDVVDSERASLCKDGPVLLLMSKRLRALKKKHNKILQIEDAKAQGKPINKEQEDVLKLKGSVVSLIDEYEKLRQPLGAAVKEELAEFEKELRGGIAAPEAETVAAGSGTGEVKEVAGDRQDSVAQLSAVSSNGVGENISHPPEPYLDDQGGKNGHGSPDRDRDVADLLTFLYFAQLFDVRSHGEASSLFWAKVHERSSCLSYDRVTEDSPSPLLESDLDALSIFGSLLTSRAPNATVSHKDALQLCIRHANLWLQNSDSVVKNDLGVTYSYLKETLNRILASEYFTMIPELKTVDQHAVAAVSGAGQYTSNLLIQRTLTGEGGPMIGTCLSAQVQLEDQQRLNSDIANYIHHTKPDVVPDAPGTQFLINQSETVIGDQIIKIDALDILGSAKSSGETQQEVVAPKNPVHHEESPELTEQHQAHAASVNVDPRGSKGDVRGYINGSGRGRGYARGARGGYGNGHSGQYYDQGRYYPKNNYPGRGGTRGRMYNGHANGQAARVTQSTPNMTSTAT